MLPDLDYYFCLALECWQFQYRVSVWNPSAGLLVFAGNASNYFGIAGKQATMVITEKRRCSLPSLWRKTYFILQSKGRNKAGGECCTRCKVVRGMPLEKGEPDAFSSFFETSDKKYHFDSLLNI